MIAKLSIIRHYFIIEKRIFILTIYLNYPAGSAIYAMDLYLDGVLISCDESNHDRVLGFFTPHNGSVIHIVDTDPFSLAKNRAFDDTSLVQKYGFNKKYYEINAI